VPAQEYKNAFGWLNKRTKEYGKTSERTKEIIECGICIEEFKDDD
jgi:hypothetical protein